MDGKLDWRRVLDGLFLLLVPSALAFGVHLVMDSISESRERGRPPPANYCFCTGRNADLTELRVSDVVYRLPPQRLQHGFAQCASTPPPDTLCRCKVEQSQARGALRDERDLARYNQKQRVVERPECLPADGIDPAANAWLLPVGIGLLSGFYFWFNGAEPLSRSTVIGILAAAVLIGALLLLPWLPRNTSAEEVISLGVVVVMVGGGLALWAWGLHGDHETAQFRKRQVEEAIARRQSIAAVEQQIARAQERAIANAYEDARHAHGDARLATPAELDRSGFLDAQPQGVRLGFTLELQPRHVTYAGDQHAMTIAPTRSGKGVSTIIPTLLSNKASIVCNDPKGQNAAITARRRRELGQEVFCLNPYGSHREAPWHLPQHGFNPLAALDPGAATFVAEVSALAAALIVAEGNRDKDHFVGAARDLVSGILMHLRTWPGETPTLERLREIIAAPHGTLQEHLALMLENRFAPVRNRVGRFLDPKTDEAHDVVSTAHGQTGFLDDPAIAASLRGNDVDFAALKTRPSSVFLILPENLIEPNRKWLRLVLTAALNRLNATPRGATGTVLFILDEMPVLGSLPALETAMGLTAGAGIKLWPILQNLGQLKQLYSAQWETFVGNAGVVQVFGTNDPMTAEYVSRRAGTATASYMGYSVNTGGSTNLGNSTAPQLPDRAPGMQVSTSSGSGSSFGASLHPVFVPRPLLRPEDVYGLGRHESLVIMAGQRHVARVGRASYRDLAEFVGQYDPDPYEVGGG